LFSWWGKVIIYLTFRILITGFWFCKGRKENLPSWLDCGIPVGEDRDRAFYHPFKILSKIASFCPSGKFSPWQKAVGTEDSCWQPVDFH
jgi:hypothetical protein